MTVNDVIKLWNAGLSEDLIIEQIRKKNQKFDLTADQLVQLKTAHVSERVIGVMIDPALDPGPTRAQPAPAAVAPSAPKLPSDAGVYAKEDGDWTELDSEKVTWKSGGAVKNKLSLGIVKDDVNGRVENPSSPNKVTAETEFLIVVPDGMTISQYQFLRLHPHGDSREFRVVAGGVITSQGEEAPDALNFAMQKLADSTYLIRLPVGISLGEYGFLPPSEDGSANLGASRQIYSFTVAE